MSKSNSPPPPSSKKAIDQARLWFADSHIRFDAWVKYAHRLAGGQQATYCFTIDDLTDKVYLGVAAIRCIEHRPGLNQRPLLMRAT